MPLDPQGGYGCQWYDVIGSRRELPNKLIPWCELIGAYTHQGAPQCQFDTQKRKKISERGIHIHNGDRW
jgi:hypothetical protein